MQSLKNRVGGTEGQRDREGGVDWREGGVEERESEPNAQTQRS